MSNAFFYYVPASLFPCLFSISSFSNFCFVGLFSYVRACCRRASTAITAQRSQPCTKQQSKYVPIGTRQRKQADRVARAESQHVVEHLHSSLRSQNERINKKNCGLHKYTTTYKAALACVMREELAFISKLNKIHSSLCPFCVFRACMRRTGCFPGAWSSWHLQVVSLHLKSWTCLSAFFAFCFYSL